MDFEAEEVTKAIPSRSSYAPSDKQKAYKAGDTLRFHIPAFQAFIDPRQTTLNFKVKIGGTAGLPLVRFSNKCGLHSIIENIRIMDANTNTVLESLMNYGEMSQKLHLYSENRSIRNKRALIEGLEYTSRDWDSELYDNEPARNSHESQLFDVSFRYDKSTNGFGDPITVTATADPNTIEVSLHLYSGVIGSLSQKVYPAMITDGLRIEIDTCRPQKCLELWTAQGFTADDGGIVTSEIAKDSARFCIIQGDVSTATPVTYIDLHCEKNPGYDQDPTATNTPTQLALDSGSTAVKNGLSGAVNLMVGKPLWGYDNANPPVWRQLGVITGVASNYATEDSGGEVSVRVFVSGGINGDQISGGPGGGTGSIGRQNSCGIRQVDWGSAQPDIVISDLQFIVKTLQPPQSYISSMLKQIATEEGVQYDYLTMDTYRNNVLAGEKVVQINIPTINHMATSIMTLPINNSLSQRYYHHNLDTIIDDADNYNYLIDNKLVPTRRVRLSQLSQTVPKTEQVALFESEKSLTSIKIHPKNLDFQEDNFFIGRGLGRYGGVYNLAATGNASLRLEYTNPLKNKLMVSYIGGIRRLTINRNGRTVQP
tara:strand:- start:8718 stop:10505 length:1788 start_codon:yes stop_codon:yes gene_type:complete